MSSAWGNQVGRWRAGINAWVVSETDTTATIRVEAVWQSVAWGYNVSNGVSAFVDCDGSDTPYVGTGGVYASSGETRTISMYTRNFTVPKTGIDRDVQCAAGVRLAGGYHDGTSRAYCTVRISHRTWYQPHRPANFAARRSSDTSQSLTWSGDYTGLEGGYPWSGVYVDRGMDGATPSNLATLGWAATNYSDNSTEEGHRYDYRLYSYGPGGTSQATDTLTLYTTPIACGTLTAYKPTATTVGLRATGAPAYVDSWEFQASTDGGATWADAAFDGDWVCADPPKGTVRFRVRALKSSGGSSPVTLHGAWAESNDVATLCAPLAPNVSAPDVVATGTAVTVTWQDNHPDGTAQSAAQVEVTAANGTVTTADVKGAATSWTRAASQQASAGTIRFRVRTKGDHADWGEWSSYAVVRVAVAPRAAITSPAASQVLDALPLAVAWEVTDATGVSQQSLSIADASGAVVWSATPGKGVRRLSVGTEAGFANKSSYTLTYSMRAGSGLTLTKTVAFSTDWAQPDAPTVTPTVGEGYTLEILIEAAQTEPEAVSFDVVRVNPDGSKTTLVSGLKGGQTAYDSLPPLNVAYSYEIHAYAASGAVLNYVMPYLLDSDGHEVLSFGSAAQEHLALRYDAQGSESGKASGETFHFALGTGQDPLPAFYADGDIDVTGSHSYVIADADEYRAARRKLRAHTDGWFRDAWGNVAVVAYSYQISYDAKQYMQWQLQLDVTETMWEEPNRG